MSNESRRRGTRVGLPKADQLRVRVEPRWDVSGSPLAARPQPVLTFEDPAYALYAAAAREGLSAPAAHPRQDRRGRRPRPRPRRRRLLPPRAFRPGPGDVEPGLAARRIPLDPAPGALAGPRRDFAH